MNFLLFSSASLLLSSGISNGCALLPNYQSIRVVKKQNGLSFNAVRLHFYGPKDLWKPGLSSYINLEEPFWPNFYLNFFMTGKAYNLWWLMLQALQERYHFWSRELREFKEKFFFGDPKLPKTWEPWFPVWEDMKQVQKQVDNYFANLKFRYSSERLIQKYTPDIKEILTNWLAKKDNWYMFRSYFMITSEKYTDHDFLWNEKFVTPLERHPDIFAMRRHLRKFGAVFQIGFYIRSFYVDPTSSEVKHDEEDWRLRWKVPSALEGPVWVVNNNSIRIMPGTDEGQILLYYYLEPDPIITESRNEVQPCFYLLINDKPIPHDYPFKNFTAEQINNVIIKQFNPPSDHVKNFLELEIVGDYSGLKLYSGGPINEVKNTQYVIVHFTYEDGKGKREYLGSSLLGFNFFDTQLS